MRARPTTAGHGASSIRWPRPLLTCEAVLSETSFLLQRVGADPSLPVTLVERGVLRIAHLLDSSAGISRPPGTRARMKRQSRPNLKRCTRKGVRSFDPTSRSRADPVGRASAARPESAVRESAAGYGPAASLETRRRLAPNVNAPQ